MQPFEFAGRIADSLAGNPDLAGLYLGGSLGNGTADAFSDIDFVALARPGGVQALAEAWATAVRAQAEIVLLRQTINDTGALLNAVTADWLRLDLFVTPREVFEKRGRDSLLPLIDPDDIHAALPETVRAPAPTAARIRWMAEEFLRVVGLIPVTLGRGELVTTQQGYGLQRDALTALMLAEAQAAPAGILHLSRQIPPKDFARLCALPAPAADRADLIAAHMQIAGHYLPRARRLLASLNGDWPQAFEDATRKRLKDTLDANLPASA